MKTRFQRSWMLLSLVASLGLALWPAISSAGEPTSTNGVPANVVEELRRLRDQIEDQGRRLDHLYVVLEPQLKEMEAEAVRLKQQKEEDKLLALDRITDFSDENLSSQGCVSPTTAEFAVITRDGAVQIFDEHGSPGRKLAASGQVITALAFSPNGTQLLTGTDGGALLVWEVAKGTYFTASKNVGKSVGRVAWMGNDKLVWGALVSYWEGGKPINQDQPSGAVLDRANGQLLWQFKSLIREDFFTLAGASDGGRLVVMEIPGKPRGAFLLDGATGKVTETFYDRGHGSGPLSVGISPDGKTLAVGYAPYDAILWDALTGERQKLLEGHSNWVVSLAFSADGKRLISGAGDSTARVWDVPSGKEIGRLRFTGESTYVNSVGLSPNGDLAFALTQQGQFVVAKVPAAGP